MSFIVKRTRTADNTAAHQLGAPSKIGQVGFTGPLPTQARAEREAAAWNAADWHAEVIEYTREVKAEVRAWEKTKKESAR